MRESALTPAVVYAVEIRLKRDGDAAPFVPRSLVHTSELEAVAEAAALASVGRHETRVGEYRRSAIIWSSDDAKTQEGP